jgi:hypothetical protein
MWTGKVWNAGPGPIRSADLRDLRFEFAEADIFGAWAVGISSEDNALSFLADPKAHSVRIGFDFLNKGDGAEFVVLHSRADTLEPQLRGALIGGTQKRVPAVRVEETSSGIKFWLSLLLLSVSIPVFVVFLMQLLESDAAKNNPAVRDAIASALFPPATAIVAVSGFLMWMTATGFILYNRYERRGEPTALTAVRRRKPT